MRNRQRLDKLIERLRSRSGETGPLTIFLVETDTDHPVGTRVIWGGRAREIAYDPAQSEPSLPRGGPHKIILVVCDTKEFGYWVALISSRCWTLSQFAPARIRSHPNFKSSQTTSPQREQGRFTYGIRPRPCSRCGLVNVIPSPSGGSRPACR